VGSRLIATLAPAHGFPICNGLLRTAYVASGDLAAEVGKLKAQNGKPMVAYGGAGFARSLIAHDLVDQFDLAHIPVVLGRGFRSLTA
jgi:dihydrofolate reductase